MVGLSSVAANACQFGFVRLNVGGEFSVGSQPEERHQLGVGQQSQQVDDSAVNRSGHPAGVGSDCGTHAFQPIAPAPCPSRHGTARDYSRFFPCFLTSEQGRKAMPYPARMTRDRLVTVIGSHRSHIQCPVAAGRVAPLRRPRHETTGLSGSGTASQDESRTRGRRQAAASDGRDRSRPLWPPRSASIHQRVALAATRHDRRPRLGVPGRRASSSLC